MRVRIIMFGAMFLPPAMANWAQNDWCGWIPWFSKFLEVVVKVGIGDFTVRCDNVGKDGASCDHGETLEVIRKYFDVDL